jgi:carboxypeptidase T
MKKLLLIILCFLCLSGFSRAEKYSEIRIHASKESLAGLAKLGIPMDAGMYHKEGYWQTIISERDLQKLRQTPFTIEVTKDDYAGYVARRNAEWLDKNGAFLKSKALQPASTTVSGYKVPVHFELGSMGGFYTLQEVMNELDSMVLYYPNLISARQEASSQTTIDGRKIYYVRISKNPNSVTAVPKVFYNSLIHAREPQGMQQLIFYMWYLLENYETSPEVKYLVDNLEMYFIPVMNPDGYEYNHSTYPIGGGMWRKNRRDCGGGNYGIDLNRNWGYEWGYDDTGSSPYPSDDTYRGASPFSEPETQIVRDLCNQIKFRESLNYHTYGDIFLFPWSYIIQYPADSAQFMNFSDLMTRQNRYSTGVPGELLYTTNGDMNDWMYGEQTAKPKAFSYTPETGTDLDGFWPQVDRILPLCQENMYQNLMMAHLAFKYAETRDAQPSIVSERTGYFKFDFIRYGIEAPANYTVSIAAMDTSQLTHLGSPQFFMNPVQFQVYTDSIAYTLSPNVTTGSAFQYIIKLSNGSYTFLDTITKYFGPKLTVFQDSCNQFTKWTSPKWGVTTSSFYSPTGSITDSPSGNYSNNTSVPVTSWNKIDLKDSPVAVISYWAKWNTERGFDYVQVLVSADNGLHYLPQKGRYTKIGSANESPGKPVYDGKQATWVNEEVVLTGYANKQILLRFDLESDASGSADGYYFDDISVSTIDMSGLGIESPNKPAVFLSNPSPNPTSGNVVITYHLPSSTAAEFELIDSRGITVSRIPLEDAIGNIRFTTESYPSGIYFYRVKGSFGTSEVKKLMVIR